MIRLTTGVPTQNEDDMKLFCKKNGLEISYMVNMGNYLHVSISGEVNNIEKFCGKVDQWKKDKREARFWYKLLKFFRLIDK